MCVTTPDAAAVQPEQQPHDTNQLPAFSHALLTRHHSHTQPTQQPANRSHGTQRVQQCEGVQDCQRIYKRARSHMLSRPSLGVVHRNRAHLGNNSTHMCTDTVDIAAADMHIQTDGMPQRGDSPQDAMWLGENPFQCEVGLDYPQPDMPAVHVPC